MALALVQHLALPLVPRMDIGLATCHIALRLDYQLALPWALCLIFFGKKINSHLRCIKILKLPKLGVIQID